MSDADRIAALEAQVHDLLVEVKRLGARRGSMAQTRHCPACGHGSLVHFKRITAHGTLALQHTVGFLIKPLVRIGAYACRQCGLVEWYTPNIEEAKPEADVELLEAPAEPPPDSGGPFR